MSLIKTYSVNDELSIRNTHFNSRIFDSDIIASSYDLNRYVNDRITWIGHYSDINSMTPSNIEDIISLYSDAALAAVKSSSKIGFVTATTGTLIGNFISSATNLRTDDWGGTTYNRLRLANSIIKRVRDTIGEEIVLEFRVSGAEFIAHGYTVEEGINIVQGLDNRADIIHVSAGIDRKKDDFIINNPTLGMLHGSNIRLAAEIKSKVDRLIATEAGLGISRLMNVIINNRKTDILYCSMKNYSYS